jgi:RimJ/RimL family protein N-acetyltransferase
MLSARYVCILIHYGFLGQSQVNIIEWYNIRMQKSADSAPVLETARLILRPFQEEDAVEFASYRSDPEVARYQGWEAPYSLEKARDFVQQMKSIYPGENGFWYQFAIELKDSPLDAPPLIGDCAFHLLAEDPSQAEIGFTLSRPYQGLGYASEAVSCLLDWIFEEFDLHRVRANCDVENLPSARLLERLGMRQEAHFIESQWWRGRWSSEFWFAILRSEWAARKK